MTDQREQQLASRTVSNSNVEPSALLAERRSLEGVDAFAGAVANVLMHSISSVTQNLVRDSSASEQSGSGDSSIAVTNGDSSVNRRLEDHPQVSNNGGEESRDSRQARRRHYQLEIQSHHSQPANQNQVTRGRSRSPLGSPTSYELASEIRRYKRPRVASFEPPSLFVERRGSRRRIRSCSSGSSRNTHRGAPEILPATKVVQYSRNVILLPPQYKNSGRSEVTIPRRSKRGMLGQAGLIGKVEILSNMTELDVRREICEVFSTPMGLTSEDIENNRLFPFFYLQGSGSHTYCVPSINKAKFEWNGKNVASLAKAGAYVYLLADANLPGYDALFKESSLNHDSQENDSGEELPDFSSVVPKVSQKEQDVIEISDDSVAEDLDNSQCNDSKESSSSSQMPSPATGESADPKMIVQKCSSSSDVDNLIGMFGGQLSPKQINAIYLLSGSNFERTMQCLLEGPSISSIVTFMTNYFEANCKATVKIDLDLDSAWQDMVGYYKSSKADFNVAIRIALTGELSIDTGGIRRQAYTQVYSEFAQNKHIHLFDGPTNLLRPVVSASARSSGVMKILGKMISHSMYQDGIGFPYLSAVCYWYLIGGENMAIQHVSLADLPADSASLIEEMKIAVSESEIKQILNSEGKRSIYEDVIQRCGISEVINMNNKELIIQEIMTFESIIRISKMLDQLAEGLQSLGLLKMMRLFPHAFATYFMYTTLKAKDVLNCISVPVAIDPGDKVALQHLNDFIATASEEVLRKFLIYVTGSAYPSEITVMFVEDDEIGALSAHTCSRELHIPHKSFSSEDAFQIFSASLMAVINSNKFNIV